MNYFHLARVQISGLYHRSFSSTWVRSQTGCSMIFIDQLTLSAETRVSLFYCIKPRRQLDFISCTPVNFDLERFFSNLLCILFFVCRFVYFPWVGKLIYSSPTDSSLLKRLSPLWRLLCPYDHQLFRLHPHPLNRRFLCWFCQRMGDRSARLGILPHSLW